MAAWEELNARQRAYLSTIYNMTEGGEEWTPYNVLGSRLKQALKRQGLADTGAGATFKTLTEHGLIQRRYKRGLGRVLLVRLTSQGKKEIENSEADSPQEGSE